LKHLIPNNLKFKNNRVFILEFKLNSALKDILNVSGLLIYLYNIRLVKFNVTLVKGVLEITKKYRENDKYN